MNQGHSAVITGSDDAGYRYDSFGKNKTFLGKDHRHGQQTFQTEQEALDFAREQGYTHFARWNTTPAQDIAAQAEADRWHSGFNEDYQPNVDYDLTNNNCQDMVNSMATAAEIERYTGAVRHPTYAYRILRRQADASGRIR
jgi:hypothetical protein